MKICFTDYFQKQINKLTKNFPHVSNDLLQELKIFYVILHA
jgi:hypothetical protein